MLDGIYLDITNITMTRFKEKERGQQVIVKLVVVKPKVLDLLTNCLIRVLEFSVKNAMHSS